MQFAVRFWGFDRKEVAESFAALNQQIEQLREAKANLERELLRVTGELGSLGEQVAQLGREKKDTEAELLKMTGQLASAQERLVELEAREQAVGMVLIHADQEAARQLASAGTQAADIVERANREAATIQHEVASVQEQLQNIRQDAISFLEQLLADLRAEWSGDKSSAADSTDHISSA